MKYSVILYYFENKFNGVNYIITMNAYDTDIILTAVYFAP